MTALVLELFIPFCWAVVVSRRESPNLNNLSSEIVYEIGSYLECPRKQLISGCKSLSVVYTRDFPYYKEVASRFDIPELFKAESSVDLGFFLNLKFVPDEITKFHLLYNHIFHHGNTFTVNGKSLGWHLYKIFKRIPEDYKRTDARKIIFTDFMPKLMKFFIKREAFDLLIEIFEKDFEEFVKGIKEFELNDAKLFLKYVENNFVSVSASVLKLLNIPEAFDVFIKALFVYFPTMAMVLNSLNGHRDAALKDCLFDLLLKFVVRDESSGKVYNRINNLIEEFVDFDDQNFYKLLNLIRFRPDIRVKTGSFNSFYCFIAASTAERQDLIEDIVNLHKTEIFEKFKSESDDSVTVKAITDLLPYLNDQEQEELLGYDDDKFTNVLLSKMAISGIKEDESGEYFIIKLRAVGVLDITIKTDYSEWYLLDTCSVIDEEALEAFLEDFAKLPDHLRLLRAKDREEINPKVETLKMMMKNKRIRDKIDCGDYCFKPFAGSDVELVEVLKCLDEKGLDELSSQHDYNSHHILIQSSDPIYFKNVEIHFRNVGQLLGLLNDSECEWNYGEVREVLFYMLKNEETREDLKDIADTKLLEYLEKEAAAEELAAILNE